jgi:dTDP-4-dehydrorhamnose 3,5-epimerase
MIIRNNGEFAGVVEIGFEPHRDERGFFMRVYDKEIFRRHNINVDWVQENYSFSKTKWTLRGLHFQYPPFVECKMIRVFRGRAFFTFLDLRRNHPTFGKWGSVILDEDAPTAVFLPRGFALGMCTLTDRCDLYYWMDNYYRQEKQGVIKWDDPDLNIAWPIGKPSVISERDENGIRFREFVETSGGILT